jgi:hypothetical protein
MTHAYTIRYRCTYQSGQLALIVEDETGMSYLFAGGMLQAQLSARLSALAALSTDWLSVSDSTAYSLTGLRQLVPVPIASGSRRNALAEPAVSQTPVLHRAAWGKVAGQGSVSLRPADADSGGASHVDPL